MRFWLVFVSLVPLFTTSKTFAVSCEEKAGPEIVAQIQKYSAPPSNFRIGVMSGSYVGESQAATTKTLEDNWTYKFYYSFDLSNLNKSSSMSGYAIYNGKCEQIDFGYISTKPIGSKE